MNNPTGGAADFLLAKAIERAEKAEAEVARLRAALGRLRDMPWGVTAPAMAVVVSALESGSS